jgi:hypothetical protein
MVSYSQLVQYLNRHSLGIFTPTAWWPANGQVDTHSSFYHVFGVRSAYNLAEVRAWLGY